jgi:site-specific DNA-methyltransferase (adenine-specific)
MKPYYQEAGIVIYHGDCREILPALPKVDLVLTDPPYGLKWTGVGFKDSTSQWRSGADMQWDIRPDAEILQGIISGADKYIIWGGNYFASDLGDCPGVLIWDKETGANSFADAELAWSNVTGTTRIFRHQWCGAFKDSERGLKSQHPTQKPEALMGWCLKLAKTTGPVLDPFMGSGTTLVACKQAGLQCTGIEREEKYCEIAANRLRQGVLWGAQ